MAGVILCIQVTAEVCGPAKLECAISITPNPSQPNIHRTGVFTTCPNPEVALLGFDPYRVQWTRRGVTPTVTAEVQDRKLSLRQIVKKVEAQYMQGVEDQFPGPFISGVRFAIAEHPEDDLAQAKRKVLQEHDWKPDDFDE